MDERYYSMDLDSDNRSDLNDWVEKGVLVGVVDDKSGIILYCHRDRAASLVRILNESTKG